MAKQVRASTKTPANSPSENVTFSKKVLEERKRAGLSQVELARVAGVSPKTLAKMETDGIARFDAIVRIAKALGQPVDEWSHLAGHNVSQAKIDSVLNQRRIIPTFPQLTPEESFDRTIQRLVRNGNIGLRCVCVMSPVPVAHPSVATRTRWEKVKEMVRKGLHIAMTVPFPFKAENVTMRLPALSKYYTSAYDWAYEVVDAFRKELPVGAERVHVFTPTIPSGKDTTLVYPPARLIEARPMLTQYGLNPGAMWEFGVYLHYPDYREDHYVDMYSSDYPANERGVETFRMWRDYFRDILDAWHPVGTGEKSKAEYSPSDPSFWEQAKV